MLPTIYDTSWDEEADIGVVDVWKFGIAIDISGETLTNTNWANSSVELYNLIDGIGKNIDWWSHKDNDNVQIYVGTELMNLNTQWNSNYDELGLMELPFLHY